MNDLNELRSEQAYMARVQSVLLEQISAMDKKTAQHTAAIREIFADIWEELRLRPTEVSTQEMQQYATDIDRFTARKQFAEEMGERAQRMLRNPFFARIDFTEDGADETEKIVIGLYSLADKNNDILVYDWRAPICGMYYDREPGRVSYASPSGEIFGEMTLKRQYRAENGTLKYYVDTSVSAGDDVLLDILSQAGSGHMRQIVSTIQAEQNAVIRSDEKKVVSVVGSAGSGKTVVAMHRAAYLMYQRRDKLTANHIAILSPSPAFSEYISNVLPELGEENIRARTLRDIVESVLGHHVEPPIGQLRSLLGGTPLRFNSVKAKCCKAFLNHLDKFIAGVSQNGPVFSDIIFDGNVLIRADELKKMYTSEFKKLTPAQRITRMRATLDTRLEGLEKRLYDKYENEFFAMYAKPKDLKTACKFAVAQEMTPIREQLAAVCEPSGDAFLKLALLDMPEELQKAFDENHAFGLTWWEDAVAEAYIMVRLGFAAADKTIWHMLADEAQDYCPMELALLKAYCPNARVTLLGDPMQRTNPALDECNPAEWGDAFDCPDAPVYTLSRCYRSALPVVELCNKILPNDKQLTPVRTDGESAIIDCYAFNRLVEILEQFRNAGYKSIAIVTRTQPQADRIADRLSNVMKLDGTNDDAVYETTDNLVACYHLTKGMEFDAVIVVWPGVALNDGERRRIYTACSRALHRVAFLADGKLLNDLGLK